MKQTSTAPQYRIGAVSRLTGVPADTLRVWERRYQVVTPQRTEGGSREYSEEDVARLGLIKRLVDSGDSISAVAALGLGQLADRVNAMLDDALPGRSGDDGPTRVVMVGATLTPRFAAQPNDPADSGIDLVGMFDRPESCARGESIDADVLVVEYAALDARTRAEVHGMQRQCNASRSIVVYGFGASEHVDALTAARIVPLRFPVSWEELRWICRPRVRVRRGEELTPEFGEFLNMPVPERTFEDAELARVANMPVSLKCECPRHLADLVMNLSRFEYYSAQCQNATVEDAALHAYLRVTTAKARKLMEEALLHLAEAEGLEIGEADPARDA
ncbi:MAG: MerR family transcriptional regulator [Chromatiales bacterium]|nr:MerR family transcriptional regulator [Gammaproteobacteria bacterium]MCP5351703.1 MerR family transcriptional regulator [Chromatiales bacterium]